MVNLLVNLLLIAIGGAIGSVARYGLVVAMRPSSPGFPLGTLACNLLGCLVIGLLAGAMGVVGQGQGEDRARLFLFTGVLGGFTTFSSFGLETIGMLRDGRAGQALAYVALSNVLGLVLVAAGWAAMHRGGSPAGTMGP